ncbi:MAG: hypothetical protein WC979_04115 [Candidatus Pacearchaeota archaeon]|jgi:hypothetical protein
MVKRNKKAAIELSMSTIVILVLAMSMLILGLVLIRTIFTGATGNVQTMNDKVKGEISKLFEEDTRAVINLPNGLAAMKQGEQFGISFGIQNKGISQKFKWKVVVQDDGVKAKCGTTEDKAAKWIAGGATGSADIASGQKYSDIIMFNVPEQGVNDVSKCIVRYQLVVSNEDGTPYATEPFYVQVK